MYDLIEKELILLGSTAIEDQMQDNVAKALNDFIKIGIKLWLLTGDKKDTAISIAFSTKFITHDYKLFDFENQTSKDEIKNALDSYLSYIDISPGRKYGLIVESFQLKLITSDNELTDKVIIIEFMSSFII